MSQAFGSVARRFGAAKRAAASWLAKPPKPRAGAPERVPPSERSGGLRPGVIEAEPPEVGLDAARLAADEGQAALAQVMADPDPSVRARALALIVEFSERRATRLLRAMIHDPDSGVRRAAAASAARLDGLGVVVSLLVALEDPDVDVRLAAARSIAQMTGQTVELPAPSFALAPDRLAELKRWWKQQRVAELVRSYSPEADGPASVR